MLKDNRSLLALDVTGLDSITNKTMQALAQNAVQLQGLNITNCKKITDESLEAVACACRHLKMVSALALLMLISKLTLGFARGRE